MSNDKNAAQGYTEDRRIYRHPIASKTSRQLDISPNISSSQRNRSEISSLFCSSNQRLEEFEKRIHQSIINDEHIFDMINYPIQHEPTTPIPNNQLPIQPPTIITKPIPTVSSRKTPTQNSAHDRKKK